MQLKQQVKIEVEKAIDVIRREFNRKLTETVKKEIQKREDIRFKHRHTLTSARKTRTAAGR